jgi:hypothetical protein
MFDGFSLEDMLKVCGCFFRNRPLSVQRTHLVDLSDAGDSDGFHVRGVRVLVCHSQVMHRRRVLRLRNAHRLCPRFSRVIPRHPAHGNKTQITCISLCLQQTPRTRVPAEARTGGLMLALTDHMAYRGMYSGLSWLGAPLTTVQ